MPSALLVVADVLTAILRFYGSQFGRQLKAAKYQIHIVQPLNTFNAGSE
jgi:hypothetical protein